MIVEYIATAIGFVGLSIAAIYVVNYYNKEEEKVSSGMRRKHAEDLASGLGKALIMLALGAAFLATLSSVVALMLILALEPISWSTLQLFGICFASVFALTKLGLLVKALE